MSKEDEIRAMEYLDRSIRRAKNRMLTLLILMVGLFTFLIHLS